MTYRAIGKYKLNATDAEKIKALQDCIVDAALELVEFGVSINSIEETCNLALHSAEDAAALGNGQ